MTSTCCREKTVLVAVYTERPRRRLPLSEHRQGGHHHHHHHHHYLHFHQSVSKNDGGGKGYNRRAELLDYARYLRASAKPAASASVSSHGSSHIKQISTVQIAAADRKPKHSSPPTCLDKWESLIPSFLRSMTALNTTKGKGKKKHKNSVSTATKMKALVKSLQVQKKGSFLSKLLTTVQKRH
ncbi:hypothetical protein Pfo_010114 [Paulownia fortunei]|nr:hypothetical protein Pfo_010114 [Paulownia fortunei]